MPIVSMCKSPWYKCTMKGCNAVSYLGLSGSLEDLSRLDDPIEFKGTILVDGRKCIEMQLAISEIAEGAWQGLSGSSDVERGRLNCPWLSTRRLISRLHQAW